MSDLGREIATAVRIAWTPPREEHVWAGLAHRRRRRRLARAGIAGLVTATACAIAAIAWRTPADDTPEPPRVPAPALAAAAMTRGIHRLSIEHATGAFIVRSGRVAIEPYDAVFASSQQDHRVRVEVHAWQPAAEEHTAPAPARDWRDLARDGDYDRAYVAFDRVHDNVEDLLLLADVMRLSHHAVEALAPLRRVVRDHPDDPRASLAAFTVGRVLLEDLGRPREANDAFADAIRLAPDGPMAEDALARQVESLSRAGDARAAQQLAEEYLRQFPNGRKLRSVRKLGGLE